MVCAKDWETRHIADFFKLNAEKNRVVDPRPEAADQFVSVTYIDTGDPGYCTLIGRSSVAGYSVAGCMIPSRVFAGGL